MKRNIILCTVVLALFTSCVKTPSIYRLLSKEEQEIVPYQLGQHIRMLNQDGDTIQLAVVRDEYVLDCEGEFYRPNKMKLVPPPYSYVRRLELTSHVDDSLIIRLVVGPNKLLQGYRGYNQSYCEVFFDLLNTPTETLEINGITYENVYRAGSNAYGIQGDESPQETWFYNEAFGILAIKKGMLSLTRVP